MQCVIACIDANGADGYSACRPGHCSCSSCPSKPHPTLRAVEGVSTAGPSHSRTCPRLQPADPHFAATLVLGDSAAIIRHLGSMRASNDLIRGLKLLPYA